MKLQIYTVFDTASGVYMRPFFMQADGQATRFFGDECLNADSDLGRHPEDYSLVSLGTYDDNKAELVPEGVRVIATGLEMVALARNVRKDNLEKFDKELGGAGYGGTN